MHTFRLLEMAGEIAREGLLRVRRPNREFLLSIRAGDFAYEDLISMAEEKLQEVHAAFASSSLPEVPDETRIQNLLLEIRHEFA
jgi:hypothetical protein